jgi:hypothetical protein
MTAFLGAIVAAVLTLLLLVILTVLVWRYAWPSVRAHARAALVDVAGPSMVRSLPPRDALEAALAPLYGAEYGDVLIGLLGGPGRELGGRDTAISRNANVHIRLESIDESVYRSELTWTYEFSGRRDNHILVIFGTHDPEMGRLVTQQRRFPIYELWKLNNEEELEDFVDDLRSAVEIGITYLDDAGVAHTVAPVAQPGEEVAWGDYQKFVRLPDHVNRADLRMVCFDLHDLADDDHVVQSVESLTLRASKNGANLGFLNWSVPFPCYLRDLEFDVSSLPREGEELSYTVVASSAGWYRLAVEPQWMPTAKKLRLSLDTWMLAGHGVTVLWRPAERPEPVNGFKRP